MKTEDMELCQQAAKVLHLRDIVLLGSRFSRGEVVAEKGVQQFKKEVKYQRAALVENDKKKEVLQCIVLLGTRVVDEASADKIDEASVLFTIEADYLVDFEISGELSEEAAKAFASFNAVHNAWPFWRQHVYDIAQKARLPHLDIPLYQVK